MVASFRDRFFPDQEEGAEFRAVWEIRTGDESVGAVWTDDDGDWAHIALRGGIIGKAGILNAVLDKLGPELWTMLPRSEMGLVLWLHRHLGWQPIARAGEDLSMRRLRRCRG